MTGKSEAEEVLRTYAGLSSGDAGKLVSAVLKAAEEEALELIAGTDPVPSNMNDVRALRLRYISQARKQTLVQREVEVIFRLSATQAANVISRMLATYAQDVDPLMKARLKTAATAEEAGDSDELRYLVHFDDAATFEYAHQFWPRSCQCGKHEEVEMFANTKATNGFAVDDIEAAKKFYGETLGLGFKVMSEEFGVASIQLAGGRDTLVYAKPDFVPATYTILNFEVDDVDAAVDELGSKGVELERYEGFEQDEKGIARGPGPSIAWFKDPAGNILSVLQQPA